MLAIIFFSVLFGLGVAAIGERGRPVLQFFQGVADAMFYVTNQVMKFAPFGVFRTNWCYSFYIWSCFINSIREITNCSIWGNDFLRCSCLRTYSENIWN